MTPAEHVVNAALPAPGAHGGDGPALARALGVPTQAIVDLSASLNPFAPPAAPMAAALLSEDPDTLRSYPDPTPATEALAAAMGVDPGRLILTNGGAEAIALLAGLQPAGWVEDPEFSLYRRHLSEIRAGAPRWRSNPSNPLGRLAAPTDQAAVWDEAFHPLATGRWSRGEDHSWRLGSLTKLWACPGLRLGYVIAPDDGQAEAIRLRQPRWAVNGLALALINPLLAATDLPGWHEAIVSARAALANTLASMGFEVTETDANWVLVADPNASLRAHLATHRVLVRDTSNFGLPGLVRVAVPAPAQLPATLSAFSAVSPDAAAVTR